MSEEAQAVGHGGAQVCDGGVQGEDTGVQSESAEGDKAEVAKNPEEQLLHKS